MTIWLQARPLKPGHSSQQNQGQTYNFLSFGAQVVSLPGFFSGCSPHVARQTEQRSGRSREQRTGPTFTCCASTKHCWWQRIRCNVSPPLRLVLLFSTSAVPRRELNRAPVWNTVNSQFDAEAGCFTMSTFSRKPSLQGETSTSEAGFSDRQRCNPINLGMCGPWPRPAGRPAQKSGRPVSVRRHSRGPACGMRRTRGQGAGIFPEPEIIPAISPLQPGLLETPERSLNTGSASHAQCLIDGWWVVPAEVRHMSASCSDLLPDAERAEVYKCFCLPVSNLQT